MKYALIVMACGLMHGLGWCGPASADAITPDQLTEALAAAKPGDVIRVADGRYSDLGDLTLAAHGTPEQPITLEPKSPGGVTFTGSMRLLISGSDFVIRGFDFDAVHNWQPISMEGARIRLTANRLIDCGDPNRTQAHIVRVQAPSRHVRIDHNLFERSLSMSVGVRTDGEAGTAALYTHIHHNVFRDIRQLSPNGQEPIQIGNGPPSAHAIAQHALVEHNLFDRADGDSEIISNKGSHNTYRHNRMVNSRGALWLRGGTDCIVEDNVMIRSHIGMVILGERHTVRRNAVIEPVHWGIELPTGDPAGHMPDKRGPTFHRPADNMVTENLVAMGPSHGGIYLRRTNFGDTLPERNRIENNTVVGSGINERGVVRELIKDTADAASHNRIARNRLHATGGASPGAAGLHAVMGDPMLPAGHIDELIGDTSSSPRIEMLGHTPVAGEHVLLDLAGDWPDGQTRWDMGDGVQRISNTRVVIHRYANAQAYDITAYLTDDDGREHRVTRSVNIQEQEAKMPITQEDSIIDELSLGEVIHHETFEGNQPLAHWTIEQMPGGTTRVVDGRLIIEDAEGCTVWFNHRLDGPVLIEYRAEVIDHGGPWDRVTDLNAFWMATDPAAQEGMIIGSENSRTGRFGDYHGLSTYYLGMGVHWNSRTRFRRYAGNGQRPMLPEHDLFGRHLLEPNQPMIVRIATTADGRVIASRDGQTVLHWRDPQPLNTGWFGFRTVHNHMAIDWFRVTRIKPSPDR